MTRETKVGLLVGLAFIVLFGVVISESADKRPVVSIDDAVTVPLPGAPDSATDPIFAANSLDNPTRRVSIAERNDNRDVVAGNGFSPEDVGYADLDSPLPGGPSVLAVESDEGSTVVAVRPRQNPDQPALPDVNIPTTLLDGPQISSLPRPGSAIALAGESARPSERQASLETQQPATSPKQKYTVVSGDSLMKIAAKVYGDQHKAKWPEILQANRDKLTDERRLRPGMELVIPPLAGADSAAVAVLPDRPAAAARPAPTTLAAATVPVPVADARREVAVEAARPAPAAPAAAEAPAKFYTVKAGDSLYRIAQTQLGSQGRWKELQELNGLSSTAVRIGQRLKLPADAQTN